VPVTSQKASQLTVFPKGQGWHKKRRPRPHKSCHIVPSQYFTTFFSAVYAYGVSTIFLPNLTIRNSYRGFPRVRGENPRQDEFPLSKYNFPFKVALRFLFDYPGSLHWGMYADVMTKIRGERRGWLCLHFQGSAGQHMADNRGGLWMCHREVDGMGGIRL
jgi:hypothetical protein